MKTDKFKDPIKYEVQDICRVMGLQDATKVMLSRKEVKDTMSLHSRSIIKKEMEGKTKCDQIYNRDFGKIQDFMRQESLENARMEVLCLTNTIDTRTTMKAKCNQKYNCPHCTICREGSSIQNNQLLVLVAIDIG